MGDDLNTKGCTKMHDIRFYCLGPRSIVCFAYNVITDEIAISRADGVIEIWNVEYAPVRAKVIVTNKDVSIEGVAWSGQRLFSVSLSGLLTEWNLSTCTERRSEHSTGNSLWCLDVNPKGTHLVVGTEEGFINVFDISDDQMAYSKIFDKQEGRILCCKFDSSGEFLVTGGIEAIRVWNVSTGQAVHKMSLSRQKANREVFVWSLQVLRDLTIISGDSRGVVTIWNGKTGVHVEEHHVLETDVLAVAVNDKENMLVCSGIDPIIRIYTLTEIKKEDTVVRKWVKYRQRNVHNHDVKALACVGNTIFSAGLDGFLGVSSISRSTSTLTMHGPFIGGSCLAIAPKKRWFLLRYPSTLEIWRLGVCLYPSDEETEDEPPLVKNNQQKVGRRVTTTQGPRKMFDMKSNKGEVIICSSMSADGNWLIYSTLNTIRLFSIEVDQEGNFARILKIKDVPEQFTVCRHVLFSNDSKMIFLVKINNTIDVFNILPNYDIDYSHTFDTGRYIKGTIHLADVSKCTRYFVTAGTCKTVAVWAIKDNQYEHHLNLPAHIALPSAISIHENQPRLVVAYADSKVVEYDFEEMRFTGISEDCSTTYDVGTHGICNILLDPRDPSSFAMHSETDILIVHKSKQKELNGNSSEAKKNKREIINKPVYNLKITAQRNLQHLVGLGWMAHDELVAVGVDHEALIAQLPPAFKQKKFGVS